MRISASRRIGIYIRMAIPNSHLKYIDFQNLSSTSLRTDSIKKLFDASLKSMA